MAADPGKAGPRRPRVLVTGFGPFPGAPENPTEAMIRALAAAPVPAHAELHLEVLPVEYAAVPQRLAVLGRNLAPDVAIHFGLSARAQGFTLERVARNGITADRPDASGECRAGQSIGDGAGELSSSLPLQAIHEALAAAGLPVFWSDDAGGYVCNYLFYHSRAHLCAGLAPSMSGFVHVPPLHPGTLDLGKLTAGAFAIIETCIREWSVRQTADDAYEVPATQSAPTGSPSPQDRSV